MDIRFGPRLYSIQNMIVKKLSYLLLAASLVISSCGDDEEGDDKQKPPVEETPRPAPAQIKYELVREYPHDATAFTEGLQFVDGYLYESTGRYGKSELRKVDLETGKVLQTVKLDEKYFGEGLAVLNGKIYQLTYMEHTGFIYDQKTLKQIGTFTFPNNEGWGMTTDGTHLIYDDGTHLLFFVDPNTFKEVKRIEVMDDRGQVRQINELEYINGYIYANQWQTNYIYKIDPATGKVVAKADLSDLRQKIGVPYPVVNDEDAPEVLNGIAYDAAGNRIFVTGKNWPKLVEIKLDN
jgi:glutamine cyclotransferase